jgi:hypothetical protein
VVEPATVENADAGRCFVIVPILRNKIVSRQRPQPAAISVHAAGRMALPDIDCVSKCYGGITTPAI